MRKKLPKSLTTHPALWGENEGFDYVYHVFLKEGYAFSQGRKVKRRI